jgi:hydrogenase expression/formation protein HypC
LKLVPEAKVGDYVLVHVGFAISRIDEEEARQTLTDLETMARLADELGPEEAVKDAVRDDEVRR